METTVTLAAAETVPEPRLLHLCSEPALHPKTSDPPLSFEAAVNKVTDEDRQRSEP